MNDLDQICIDLETLSTRNNAVIVTIAAVKFNLKDNTTEQFSVNIEPRSSKALGLDISVDTLDWWKKQRPEAVKMWQHSQIDIFTALDQFSEFCGDSKHTHYWSNRDWFDFPKLEESYYVTGKKVPFRYYNVHDMATAYYLGGLDVNKEERIGTYHNALDDCMNQIRWLKKVLGINK